MADVENMGKGAGVGSLLGPIGTIGGALLGGLFGGGGGGGQQQLPTNISFTNPLGRIMLEQMIMQKMRGGGEGGFGPAMTQGMATLGQHMAGRGISPGSGTYASEMGKVARGALEYDAQNRFGQMMALATAAPPSVAHTGELRNAARYHDPSPFMSDAIPGMRERVGQWQGPAAQAPNPRFEQFRRGAQTGRLPWTL